MDSINQADIMKATRQWISDVYHCSESWGETMTEQEMYIMLSETEKQKNPSDFSPDPQLFRECTKYWSRLCRLYPG